MFGDDGKIDKSHACIGKRENCSQNGYEKFAYNVTSYVNESIADDHRGDIAED